VVKGWVAEWLKAPVLKTAHYRFSRTSSLFLFAALSLPLWLLAPGTESLTFFAVAVPVASF
jgi:hypothetical protein